jgi:hypothetical protein
VKAKPFGAKQLASNNALIVLPTMVLPFAFMFCIVNNSQQENIDEI